MTTNAPKLTLEQTIALVLTDIKLGTCDQSTFSRLAKAADWLNREHRGVMCSEVQDVPAPLLPGGKVGETTWRRK